MRIMKKAMLSTLLLCILLAFGCDRHLQEKDLRIVEDNPKQAEDLSIQIRRIFASLTGKNENMLLRSSEEETLGDGHLRITNFAPDGYILYIADSMRGIDVLAFSETGDMHSRDTIDNPVLKTILDNARLITDLTTVFESISGNDTHKDLDLCSPIYHDSVTKENRLIYPPSTLPFGQRKPYKNHIHRSTLGCGNTAIAMMMSHYRIPKEVHVNDTKTKMQWESLHDSLNLEDNDVCFQLAEMCKYIFYTVPYVKIIFDCMGTAVTPGNIKNSCEIMDLTPNTYRITARSWSGI